MSATIEAVGLRAGNWVADPAHSEVGFVVRHLMVSKVKGAFGKFDVRITVGEDPLGSKVEASIDAASIDTRDSQRDSHLRSGEFLDVEKYPTLTFVSKSVAAAKDGYRLVGDLTIRDVTREVELDLEFNGATPDPFGGLRAGFSASTEISRADFGMEFNIPMDGGGVVVGDRVKVHLEIEAVHQAE